MQALDFSCTLDSELEKLPTPPCTIVFSPFWKQSEATCDKPASAPAQSDCSQSLFFLIQVDRLQWICQYCSQLTDRLFRDKLKFIIAPLRQTNWEVGLRNHRCAPTALSIMNLFCRLLADLKPNKTQSWKRLNFFGIKYSMGFPLQETFDIARKHPR